MDALDLLAEPVAEASALGSDQPASDDLFELASIAMAVAGLDGEIVRANTALCDLLGRSREQVLATTWADLTHPDDCGASAELFDSLAAGRQRHFNLQKRYVRPDGSTVVAHVTSDLITVNGASMLFTQMRDVTNEHDALAEVCTVQQRWRTFADSSSDVFWVQAVDDGHFSYVSESIFELTGYTPDDVYADPLVVERLIHPEDRHLLDELSSGRDPSGGALVRWVRRDGTVVWVEQRITRITAIGSDSGEQICVAHDVTERINSGMAGARHDAQQRAVTAIAQACIAKHDRDSVLDDAVAAVGRLVPCDVAAVWWEIEPGAGFRLAAQTGMRVLDSGCATDAITSHPARVRCTDAVTTFHRRGVLDAAGSDELESEHIQSGIGVPIRSAGRVVAVIAGYSRTNVHLAPEDVTFLQAVATTIGACVDRMRFDELLTVQSLHDPLTGLPNRIVLLEHLGRALDLSDEDSTVVVAICDLDDFLLFNEAMGHDFGDRLLTALVHRLTDVFAGALVCRTGGDEFTIVLTCPADDPRIDTLGSELTSAMALPLSLGDIDVTASCSVGITTASSPIPVDDALAAALAAMNRAKARGRGLWMYSSGDEQAAAVRRLDMTTALRTAVHDGGIAAYFQPIVDLSTEVVVGFEALARWALPNGRFVPPSEFVPVAEASNLMLPLGLSMLDQSCELVERLHDTGCRTTVQVSVNVSSRQLDDPGFPAQVAECLARHGVPAASICLELTESSLVPDDQLMIDRLHALKHIGVRLAIDDFGTGYSSFAYLTQFPIDVLKLDRALVTEVQNDTRRLAVARSIVGLANTLGITVIAEGVESKAERAILTTLGCSFGQGYLWGKAVPAARAIASVV